jgi:formylglycine-generating enzyme required for sulfatase activity
MWNLLAVGAALIILPATKSEAQEASWVRVPAGVFTMGSPPEEVGRDDDEGPVHVVHITKPFVMKKTEVTQNDWASLFGTRPAKNPECGEDCAVNFVNWWETLEYCNALSRHRGLPECYELLGCVDRRPGTDRECTGVVFAGLDCPGYRLPTEAEWEYAARAGGSQAVSSERQRKSGGAATASSAVAGLPVSTDSANPWGLVGMAGGVWEWCWDWFAYYAPGPVSDPEGPRSGQYRVFRGGGRFFPDRHARPASRSGFFPGFRAVYIGFRPVRTVIMH